MVHRKDAEGAKIFYLYVLCVFAVNRSSL
jgi:hypothetical protein